jgi:hypothetical protein
MSSFQEIFDQIVTHLRKQGCKSIAGASTCLYRGPNGTKCAVGCMISDDDYDPSMEGKGITTIIRLSKNLKVLSPYRKLLVEMQNIHDDRRVEDWEREFQLAAVRFNLNYTFV